MSKMTDYIVHAVGCDYKIKADGWKLDNTTLDFYRDDTIIAMFTAFDWFIEEPEEADDAAT